VEAGEIEAERQTRRLLQELKCANLKLPCDSANPLLSIYPREMKICIYAWTTQMSIN
jgi:hypothetical protein